MSGNRDRRIIRWKSPECPWNQWKLGLDDAMHYPVGITCRCWDPCSLWMSCKWSQPRAMWHTLVNGILREPTHASWSYPTLLSFRTTGCPQGLRQTWTLPTVPNNLNVDTSDHATRCHLSRVQLTASWAHLKYCAQCCGIKRVAKINYWMCVWYHLHWMSMRFKLSSLVYYHRKF